MKLILPFLFLLVTTVAIAQTGSIQGTINTSNSEKSDSLVVYLKGTSYNTYSKDGAYRLDNVDAGKYTLLISSSIFEKYETTIEVKGNETTYVPEVELKAKTNTLNEVVILGAKNERDESEYVSKVPLKNLENSQVYSVIDKEILTTRQVTNMEDAMKSATGVSVVFPATGRATDGGTIYTSRGFTTTASIINGVAGSVYNNPDASNIERIEVIKGPSATLFGSSLSSFGGAINVVTKRPYDTLGGNVTLTGGSWGLHRLVMDFNSPLNKDKTALFRVTGAYHHQNSFQDYGFTQRIAVAPSLALKVNKKTSFLLETNFSQVKATLPSWYYADSATTNVTSADKLGIDNSKYYFPGDLYNTTTTANAMAQMNHQISSKWRAQTVFSTSYNQTTGAGTYLWYISDTSLTRNNQAFEGSNTQINLQQNFLGDFNLAKMRHRFLVGVDYYQNAANSTYKFYGAMTDTVFTNQANPNYMDYNKDKYNNSPNSYFFGSYTGIQKIQRAGIYVSDVVNVLPSLILNLGLRYDYFNSDGYTDPTQDTIIGAYFQGGFSPKAGVLYQLVKEKLALFTNYQNSFQNVNGKDFYGKRFIPQQANQVEAGVKFNLLKNRIGGTVSYYHITLTNSVRTDTDHPLFSKQDGTQRSKGIETEISINAFKGFNVLMGYGYNDNIYTKAAADVIGRRPIESGANHLAHFWISYKLEQGKFQGIGAGIGGNYSSKKYVNNDTYYGVFYLPEYTVLNAGVFYDQAKYRVAVNVNNFTNQRYWVGWNQITVQKPREVTASVAWKF